MGECLDEFVISYHINALKMRFFIVNITKTLPLLAVVLGLFSACRREPVYVGTLDGGGNPTSTPKTKPCSADSVYFSQQVLPILTSNCAMSGCHDAASRKDGVILDTYDNVRKTGKINLTNPASSKLYSSLNLTNSKDRMPPAPAAALPADQKAIILKWIQQGAQNLTCDAACDTSNVRFSTVVKPLLDLKCLGCHTTTNPQGNVSLSTYADVKATVTKGTLWGSINHATGYKPMPYPAGSDKLPYCDVRKIRIWINKGAPND